MTAEFDGYILEFPGLTRSLARNRPCDAVTPAIVGEALAAFAPLLRPQSVDVLLYAYERDTEEPVELAHPHWFITTPTAAADLYVEPSAGHAVIRHVDMITAGTIEALIDEAIATEALPSGIVARWNEIRIYAVEVRLPTLFEDRDVLSLEVAHGDIGVKIEHRPDGAWVRSPKSPAEARPLVLKMSGEFPDIEVITYWSLWAPGGPGEPDLNAVFDTLLAHGWIRS